MSLKTVKTENVDGLWVENFFGCTLEDQSKKWLSQMLQVDLRNFIYIIISLYISQYVVSVRNDQYGYFFNFNSTITGLLLSFLYL